MISTADGLIESCRSRRRFVLEGKTRNLNRPKDEPLSRPLERLRQVCAKPNNDTPVHRCSEIVHSSERMLAFPIRDPCPSASQIHTQRPFSSPPALSQTLSQPGNKKNKKRKGPKGEETPASTAEADNAVNGTSDPAPVVTVALLDETPRRSEVDGQTPNGSAWTVPGRTLKVRK